MSGTKTFTFISIIKRPDIGINNNEVNMVCVYEFLRLKHVICKSFRSIL